MTDTSVAHDQESRKYPLSFTQEWFLTMDRGDDGGPFGRRYSIVCALRVTGRVDLAVLQASLDDVVERHELLRTLVVRDADPAYQMVFPPCQVPLEVRDMPDNGTSRDMTVQELLVEIEASTISAREVPLMRAVLARFDDRDSALFVMVHHSVSDAWSVQVILRDLATFYSAKVSGTTPKLPPMRQYREYAQWQRDIAAKPADDDGAMKFWADKLDGAREFVIPNDHEHPENYSRPYSLHVFTIDADTMTGAIELANATRGTLFMVILSAIYLFANKLTGVTDLTVKAVTAGRNELQFHNTMGLFLNVVPFRTQIDGCTSFRSVVMKTRETVIDAMASELPAGLLEETFPDYISSRDDTSKSQFLISDTPSPYGELKLPIAEGATEIGERVLQAEETHDVPSGTVLNLGMEPTGELNGSVLYNLDEFETSTVEGWIAELKRILAGAASDPDQDWRRL